MLGFRTHRNRLALFASLVVLSVAMVIWGDLFRWSKVVYVPDWAQALPTPMMTPSYLAFICLLPAALGTDSLAAACSAIAKSVLLSPLAGLVAYTANPLYQDHFLIANVLFNYVWMVLFFCLLPAFLALLVRAILDHARQTKPG